MTKERFYADYYHQAILLPLLANLHFTLNFAAN
jgi:hypothetical protein